MNRTTAPRRPDKEWVCKWIHHPSIHIKPAQELERGAGAGAEGRAGDQELDSPCTGKEELTEQEGAADGAAIAIPPITQHLSRPFAPTEAPKQSFVGAEPWSDCFPSAEQLHRALVPTSSTSPSAAAIDNELRQLGVALAKRQTHFLSRSQRNRLQSYSELASSFDTSPASGEAV